MNSQIQGAIPGPELNHQFGVPSEWYDYIGVFVGYEKYLRTNNGDNYYYVTLLLRQLLITYTYLYVTKTIHSTT